MYAHVDMCEVDARTEVAQLQPSTRILRMYVCMRTRSRIRDPPHTLTPQHSPPLQSTRPAPVRLAAPKQRPARPPRRHMLIPGVGCLPLQPLPPDVDKRPPEAYRMFFQPREKRIRLDYHVQPQLADEQVRAYVDVGGGAWGAGLACRCGHD